MFGNFPSGTDSQDFQRAGGEKRSARNQRLPVARSWVPVFELLEQRAMLTSLTAFPGTADGAAGSLRADIIAADADAGTATDTIQLLSGTYTLNLANSQANGHENASATGDLNITSSAHTLIIQGQGSTGPNATIIDQTALDRVFEVAAGVTVVFENVEITGGTAVDDGTSGALPFSTDANGGGILNAGGNVTLTNVAVVGNQAGVASNTVQETISGEGQNANGGGIFSGAGLLTINGTVAGASLVENNSAIGGSGDTAISGAGTQGGNAGGGGIFSSKETGQNIVLGQVLISNATFQGNSVQGGTGGAGGTGSSSDNGFGHGGGAGGSATGGAIYLDGDSTTGDALSNDIFSTNTATGGAGGTGGAVDAAGSNGFTPTGGSGGDGGSAAGGAVADSSGAGTFTADTFSSNLAQGGGGAAGGAGGGGFGAGTGGKGGIASGGGYAGLGNANTNPAIGFIGSDIMITDSALFGNHAFGGAGASGATGGVGGDGDGGGLSSSGLLLDTTLTNDTITGNTAKGGTGGNTGGNGGNALGGAIFDGVGDNSGDSASVSATNDTINANSAQAGTGTTNGTSWGGGLFARVAGVTPDAPVTAVVAAPQNLLIAGNSATNGPDFVGSITNSDHNLIGDGTDSNFSNGVHGDQVGTTQSPITVNLGPLKNNGGVTETEGLPTGNPAIGLGDPAAATAASLSTDQRGPGFSRFNGGKVDIGAYELQAIRPVVTGATTTENVQTTSGLVITPGNTLTPGNAPFFQITGITGGTLFQADGTTPIANGDFITAAQGAAGLKFTPATGSLTAGSFSVQGSTTNAVGGLIGSTAKARIAVTLSQPNVTGATTTVNTQTTSGLVITPGTHDTSAAFFQITNINGGTLFQADGTTAITNGGFITLAQGAAGLKFTPSTGSTSAGGFTVRESTTGGVGGLNGPSARAVIAVSRIQPTFVGATTTENVQTTSGLVITPGNAGAQFFQVTAITGGTLFQADGTTPIASGGFITAAQGAAGLKFTPTTGSVNNGSFLLQGSTTNAVGGLVGSIERVTIAVTLSLPAVTSATTPQNAQTTSGLVVTPGLHDTSAAFFQVSFITGGTLFLADGVTPIANGSFITLAQGAAGLKFTPNPSSLVPGGFSVRQSTTADVTGLSGPTARAVIAVTRTEPAATGATTTENVQTTSGLVITPGNSGAQFYQITAITGGTLFQVDGTTAIASGDFITSAQGAAGLKFTPTAGSVTNASFLVQGSTTSAVGGLTGSTESVAIAVTLSQPNVTAATTPKNTQTTSGLVITPGANDTSAAFFQITAISGGTLFQNDGTTPITNGSFITLAQGAAGLKFTPTTGSVLAGGFTVRQSTTGAVGGLSGPTARDAITVT